MDARDFLRSYCRSPLGISSFFLAALVGASAGLLGMPLLPCAALGIGCLAATLGVSLALGFGQRAASSEIERADVARNRARLATAGQARTRLASMRLGQEQVAQARDLVALEAGRFLEGCERLGAYDPEAAQAILDSVELVDAWLREADESAVEARFAAPDAHPFPDAAARTAAALREKAAAIAAGRERVTCEISGADRLAIEEELK
jgi:hypothetical protein